MNCTNATLQILRLVIPMSYGIRDIEQAFFMQVVMSTVSTFHLVLLPAKLLSICRSFCHLYFHPRDPPTMFPSTNV